MSSTRDFMIGVLVGSAVGACAALLYAPQTGEETRTRIKEKTSEAMDRTSELASQAKERAAEMAGQARMKAGEVASQAQGRISDLSGQAKAKVDSITQQAHAVIDRGRETIDHQKEAIMSAVEAGKQAYTEKQGELKQEVDADTQPAITPTMSSAV
jgi:gas vesicle protein